MYGAVGSVRQERCARHGLVQQNQPRLYFQPRGETETHVGHDGRLALPEGARIRPRIRQARLLDPVAHAGQGTAGLPG